ncbi:MAG: TIGR02757 family protein [Planctomycetota bacterium]
MPSASPKISSAARRRRDSKRQVGPHPDLPRHLEALLQRPDVTELRRDPLLIPHEYDDPADAELAGLIAACLAYGRVETILQSVRTVLGILGDRPAIGLMATSARENLRALSGFRHRFNGEHDLALLLHYAREMIRRSGSIGEFFAEGDPGGETIEGALSEFCRRALAIDPRPVIGRKTLPVKAGVRYLLSSPANGSACKRMNLLLRWMIRPADGLDLGLWQGVGPHRLVMPLDTHTARISRYLGLSSRRSIDWRMAVEVTESLRKIDPEDPIRFDYALCHFGILEHCPAKFDARKCEGCDLKGVCRA